MNSDFKFNLPSNLDNDEDDHLFSLASPSSKTTAKSSDLRQLFTEFMREDANINDDNRWKLPALPSSLFKQQTTAVTTENDGLKLPALPVFAKANTTPSDASKKTTTDPLTVKTLFAKVVYAFKVENSQNIAQGRVGLALLEQPGGQLQVILYRTKQDVLSACTHRNISSMRPIGEYVQYADDAQRYWSVCFDSAADREQFLRLANITEAVDAIPIAQDAPQQSAREQEAVEPKHPPNDQPTIVERMAKMGQSVPFMQAKHGEQPNLPATRLSVKSSSDSDSDYASAAVALRTSPPTAKPSPALRTIRHQQPNTHTAVLNANTLIAYSGAPTSAIDPMQLHNSQHNELLTHFSETRMQNAEMRMGLSKLESRVDRMLDQFQAISTAAHLPGRVSAGHSEAELIALEERILALRKENLELRASARSTTDDTIATADRQPELLAKQSRIDELEALQRTQSERIAELAGQLRAKDERIEELRREIDDRKGAQAEHVAPADDRIDAKQFIRTFYQRFQQYVRSDGTHLNAADVLSNTRQLIQTILLEHDALNS